MNLNKEEQLFKKGYKYIAGVDEAGRGPLAGPVVAAAVIVDANFILKEDDKLLKVNDSKKLSAKNREKLFSLIKERALSVEISVVSSQMIDKTNILKASLTAMGKAIEKSNVKPDYVVVDGNFKIPKLETKQECIIGGDALVWTIAAASIIAKVSRDYLMSEYDKKYPEYLFAKHKGYGTKLHMEKIAEFGPCPIHRFSFKPMRKDKKKEH